MIQIPVIMSCSNNPSGKPFKCSVRFPSFKVHSLVSTTELVGEMLCMVTFPYSIISSPICFPRFSSSHIHVVEITTTLRPQPNRFGTRSSQQVCFAATLTRLENTPLVDPGCLRSNRYYRQSPEFASPPTQSNFIYS